MVSIVSVVGDGPGSIVRWWGDLASRGGMVRVASKVSKGEPIACRECSECCRYGAGLSRRRGRHDIPVAHGGQRDDDEPARVPHALEIVRPGASLLRVEEHASEENLFEGQGGGGDRLRVVIWLLGGHKG